METMINIFNSMGIDFDTFWKAAAILLLGTFLFSVFGRFVFGKRSSLNIAVSSAFAILFIYAGMVIVSTFGGEIAKFITPLPFVDISGDKLFLFSFVGTQFTAICSEVLDMLILAFLVNLADRWIPRGKNVFLWLLLRVTTVILAYIAYYLVVGILAQYVPEGIATYAPVVLVAVVVLLLLTGALKIVVGAALTTVNPIIGALYTFFFANVIGKMITRAVLTTAILGGLIYALGAIGVTGISIAAATLPVYIPILIIVLVLWFVVGRFL